MRPSDHARPPGGAPGPSLWTNQADLVSLDELLEELSDEVEVVLSLPDEEVAPSALPPDEVVPAPVPDPPL